MIEELNTHAQIAESGLNSVATEYRGDSEQFYHIGYSCSNHGPADKQPQVCADHRMERYIRDDLSVSICNDRRDKPVSQGENERYLEQLDSDVITPRKGVAA